ncbi:MAG TPA: hypothetical protein VJ761_07250, partial [Ktedonobacteraceae bacterium]|nr:hypothetical protein [Ktedonobacteraceae bacterium]
VYEVLEHVPDLWAYAAGHVGGADGLPDGWLRYVVPAEDTNRSRWPVHPCWQVIQGAFLPSVSASVPIEMQPFQRQCKRKVNMMRAFAAVAGYTSTVEAWRRGYADERKREEPFVEPDISDTFHFLYVNVQAYLDDTGREYSKLVQKKRVLYQLASIAS